MTQRTFASTEPTSTDAGPALHYPKITPGLGDPVWYFNGRSAPQHAVVTQPGDRPYLTVFPPGSVPYAELLVLQLHVGDKPPGSHYPPGAAHAPFCILPPDTLRGLEYDRHLVGSEDLLVYLAALDTWLQSLGIAA